MKVDHHTMPEHTCPACFTIINETHALSAGQIPAGQLAVCLHCCAVVRYDDKLRLSLVPDDEVEALAPNTRNWIRNFQKTLFARGIRPRRPPGGDA